MSSNCKGSAHVAPTYNRWIELAEHTAENYRKHCGGCGREHTSDDFTGFEVQCEICDEMIIHTRPKMAYGFKQKFMLNPTLAEKLNWQGDAMNVILAEFQKSAEVMLAEMNVKNLDLTGAWEFSVIATPREPVNVS